MSKTVVVADLGRYDLDGGGLSEPTRVGLWNSEGRLLAWATVPAGAGARRRDGVCYTPITAVELHPGLYCVAAQTFAGGESFVLDQGAIVAADGMAWCGAQYHAGTNFSRPLTFGSAQHAYFGPAFGFRTDRGTNLVRNASFEATPLAAGESLSTASLPGWEVEGTVMLAKGLNASNWGANDQANWLLVGHAGAATGPTVSQAIDTVVGQTYEYSFACSAFDGVADRTWTLTYSIGAATNTLTFASGYRAPACLRPWQVAHGIFVATEVRTSISFTGDTSHDGLGGVALDQIWLGAAAPAGAGRQTGEWKFDGDHADVLGGSDAAFVGEETYVDGYLDRAVSLDGSNYLDLGPRAVSTSAYTKAAWVRRSGGRANHVFSGDDTSNRHAFLAPEASGFALQAGHNGAWDTVRDSVPLGASVWTHVAVTYDQAEQGGTLRLYRNGRPTSGVAVATNVPPANGGAALIGGFSGPGSGWVGQIDEARLWDRALRPEEVEQCYRDSQHAHAPVFELVPEAAEYEIVYELPIPDSGALSADGRVAYAFDNSTAYGREMTFDRVAYFLELTPAGVERAQWVFVSCDPFTPLASLIGVPAVAADVSFQVPLSHMNVVAGGRYVTTGTNLSSGNLEFWNHSYSPANDARVPNAVDALFDSGDARLPGTGTYGSMQIHNHAVNGTAAAETVFAYNGFAHRGTSDLGIGNNTVGSPAHPDWTLRQNANTYTTKNLVVLARPVVLPRVTFLECPKPLQLYPRDVATGRADVRISGSLGTRSCSRMTVSVKRAGSPYTNLTQSLADLDGAGSFAFTIPIQAELADYDFTVSATCNQAEITVATAEDVVAGDAFLINGQSNAVADKFAGSANANRVSWVRSFGYRSELPARTGQDLNWHVAEGDASEGPGAIGQWGLRMGRLLVESQGIPVAILNGGRGGVGITYFQRIDSDPATLNYNYGRLRYRAEQAGLAGAIRAVFWYQGESDLADAAWHEAGFLTLYRDWQRDYPSIERIYMCQIKNGCRALDASLPLRERQRLMADQYERLEVLSTSALQHHADGCHFGYVGGYQTLGEQMTRLVLRDLYRVPQPSEIDPPNIAFAYYADPSGSNVVAITRNPAERLAYGATPTDFRIEGSGDVTNAVVTAGTASGNVIRLTFDRDVRAGTGLSYTGHAGGAPYLTNSLGVGLLYFYNQPIHDSTSAPGAPVHLEAHGITSQRIDLCWAACPRASGYVVERDGVLLGTAYETWFSDYAAAATHRYRVAAWNPFATSGWSGAASPHTVPENVFRHVVEAADYEVLYQLDLEEEMEVGEALDVPYRVDNSTRYAPGILRVAYYLELQDRPGTPLRWVYVSMQAFTDNPLWLGVPVARKGKVFQGPVSDMHLYSSANAGLTNGLHLTTGAIEFWPCNYTAANAAGIRNASSALFDQGDRMDAGSLYGSMQIHNSDVDGDGPGTQAQTILAFNRWAAPGADDIGIGSPAGDYCPDWTLAGNAVTWSLKRLYVLVLEDRDADGMPDAWERRYFGSLSAPGSGPDDDPDGDGFMNRQEHAVGTDPTRPSSGLRTDTPVPGGGGMSLHFETLAGCDYVVEYKRSLSDPEWTTLAVLCGVGETVQVSDPASGQCEQGFYRVRIDPAEP